MMHPKFRTKTASFLYDELQGKVTETTLAFVCNSVDAASLDSMLRDPRTFPRDISTVSLACVQLASSN
ncbi:uncharacterized protein FOMMEDRAFT_23764 [Fomitiporia mediterranea MF3/22]|uniref:uncharacterized protein n=1 Tax=Fomitiporia mediterranea (strain MF3/22) TaxID=694068 RepID=UPI000440768F|nr:uncharacterized protein FOMMEDRAFT_23764 [Fomitiporia mediterranea MF3/22]EJC98180.1 hypothetical protein FOMMEDRAFT_23764 [Fomitiporia mediterranea MF3/22]